MLLFIVTHKNAFRASTIGRKLLLKTSTFFIIPQFCKVRKQTIFANVKFSQVPDCFVKAKSCRHKNIISAKNLCAARFVYEHKTCSYNLRGQIFVQQTLFSFTKKAEVCYTYRMYYRYQKKIFSIVLIALSLLVFLAFSLFIMPQNKSDFSLAIAIIVPSLVFLFLYFASLRFSEHFDGVVQKKIFNAGPTKYMKRFIAKLQFCYSQTDLYVAIAETLEYEAECSVFYIDAEKNYVLYNSQTTFATSSDVRQKLEYNFSSDWKDGVYLLDEELGIASNPKNARGFFIASKQKHFFVFCRYAKLFDESIYDDIFKEFQQFQSREETIANLSEISNLTIQWQQLADTQHAFLPNGMPTIKKMRLASYYKPLVNVSGDYYTVVPIDENKTLLLLGDVSGKGLAAALIMGLVVNTVKITKDKEDLPTMILQIDKAIKAMKLQDKYTVLVIAIVDTKKMSITYVNASMADPIILSKGPEGYRTKPLTSNANLVGIIDMGDIEVAEQKLYHGDMILMASDGISEVMNKQGEELGDTEIFKTTLEQSAEKQPQEFIDDVVNLIADFSGNAKLHDDVTMLVAKVG